MASGNAVSVPHIEKLKGRDNYNDWKFAMQASLQLEDLWECVSGDFKVEANVDAEKKDVKAKARLILSIEPVNYVHIQSADTAKDVWECLKAVFEDTGLTRKVGLLRTLITTRLEDSTSVEAYVNTIITTAHKLNGIGFKVNEEWIGALLLAGLPDEYGPMLMGIESSGTIITGDYVKTKLLQDVKLPISTGNHADHQSAFFGKKVNFKRRPRCYRCNEFGHIAANCNNKNVEKSFNNSKPIEKSAFTTACANGDLNVNEWYIDSGASAHMCKHGSWMRGVKESAGREIVLANNSKIEVNGIGMVDLLAKRHNNLHMLEISNVLLVPKLTANLLSVSQITNHNHKVVFDKFRVKIFDQNGSLLVTGSRVNDMYQLDKPQDENNATLQSQEVSKSFNLWHRRLGHLNLNSMNLLRDKYADGVNFKNSSNEICIDCAKGKQHRQPFGNSEKRAQNFLELVHSDLCGPMETKSLGGNRYFLTFLDDYSKKVFVYFLEAKDEVVGSFKRFKSYAERQTGQKLKTLRSDNGSEYINKSMINFMRQEGIRHQTTTAYSPEQNGTAERMNRTLVEKARCMLSDAKLSKIYWSEAIATAAYLVNRSPKKGLDKTPEEIWTGVKPDLRHLRVFGAKALAHIPKQKRKKWDLKSEECIFLGYFENSKAYRLYSEQKGEILKSRDVIFIESSIPVSTNDDHEVGESSSTTLDWNIDEVGETSKFMEAAAADEESCSNVEENNNEVKEEETNKRVRRLPPKLKDYDLNYNAKVSEVCLEPLTYEEAMSSSEFVLWKKAMQEEYDSLIENGTWTLVDIPSDRKAIKCKWIYKTKCDGNGNINRYKARLVVKGCSQREGIDYEETYSPVVRYSSIRYLIGLAVRFDLDIDNMDAVSAFLQGELQEEIYMCQPEGYNNGSSKVCRLKKALYGLKQASRTWNSKLDSVLKDFGMKSSSVDPCIYHKIENEQILLVAVYVDDLMLFSNDKMLKDSLKQKLSSTFNMKDLGAIQQCLGMRFTRDREVGKIWIDQQLYIEKILKKYGMADCNSVLTPFDANQKLTKDMTPKSDDEVIQMENVPYQEVVGSIMFAAQVTRPDICYAISTVSKFNSNPCQPHWNAVKRILRYLRGTVSAKLEFSKTGNSEIIGYSDSDWANDLDDRRSVTGYIFKLQGGAISWNSKRQPTVALSTTEAEYMAISAATQEALWLRNFEDELKLSSNLDAITICCDNRSAVSLASTGVFHARTKHIDIRHHFIRQRIQDKEIQLTSVSTDQMIADGLTKPLFNCKHSLCLHGMGLVMQ